MVCFRYIMVFTLHKVGDAAYDEDNNNRIK